MSIDSVQFACRMLLPWKCNYLIEVFGPHFIVAYKVATSVMIHLWHLDS